MPRSRPARPRTPPRRTAPTAPPAAQPIAAESPPPAAAPLRRRPQRAPDDGYVAVGRVLGPFGLKGELKVQSLTDNAARFERGSRLFAGRDPVTVASSREAQGYVFVHLKGFTDRAAVERFRHAMLQVPESGLAPLPEGEYYRFQLIGLTVVDRDGAVLGTLDEVIETGANDVYRVHPAEGPDLLLPALDDVIISIDLDARRMVVDPPAWR